MVKKKEVKKYYELLEVSHKASYEEVQKSYERLIHLYSDDSIVISPIEEEFSDGQKKEILNELENAYSQIKKYLKIVSPSEASAEKEVESKDQVEGEPVKESENEMILTDEIAIQENIIEITFDDEKQEGIEFGTIDEAAPVERESAIFIDDQDDETIEAQDYEDTLKEEPMIDVKSEKNSDTDDLPDEKTEIEEHRETIESEGEKGNVEDSIPVEGKDKEVVEDSVETVEQEQQKKEEPEADAEDIGNIEETEEQAPVVEINLDSMDEGKSMGLKEAREKMGFKVHDIGVALNIPYKILVNIEMEKFHKLPEDGYLRWYISTYAKYLTLDSKAVADDYMTRYREWKKSQD